MSGSSGHCSSRNRVLVHSGGFQGRLLQIICPEDSSSAGSHVEVYSQGWSRTSPAFTPHIPHAATMPHFTALELSTNALIVELVSLGTGSNGHYEIRWLQISKTDEPLTAHTGGSGIIPFYNTKPSNSFFGSATSIFSTVTGSSGDTSSSSSKDSSRSNNNNVQTLGTSTSAMTDELESDVCFKFKCPELNACISPSLFCDGREHCPSGHDESGCDFLPIPKMYLFVGAGSIFTILVLSVCFACISCRRRAREARENKLLMMASRTPTEELFFGTGTSSHREIVC